MERIRDEGCVWEAFFSFAANHRARESQTSRSDEAEEGERVQTDASDGPSRTSSRWLAQLDGSERG